VAVRAKVFDYVVEIDRAGRMTIPGGAQIAAAQGWTADHLLLVALVRCSIDSLVFHARRAGHDVSATGEGHGTVTKRDDGRYAFVEIGVRVDAQLTPRAESLGDLLEKAERDCFVGATLNVEPGYEWHVS
jgi:organic hydroperoxide reductase OsmC/OhrA